MAQAACEMLGFPSTLATSFVSVTNACQEAVAGKTGLLWLTVGGNRPSWWGKAWVAGA